MDPNAIRAPGDSTELKENEFRVDAIEAGKIFSVVLDGESIAVYNVNGTFFATQDRCPHTGWPLSDGGELEGKTVTCPLHGWCFDVTDGSVVRGMKSLKLNMYRVMINGNIGHVTLES